MGHVTRTHEIMNLPSLAPDIQEEILFLPPIESGKDVITERRLRAISGVLDWGKQRLKRCERAGGRI